MQQNSKSRTKTWLAVIVVAAGVPLAVLAGVLMYMNVTATPLHPNPQDVPSVMHSAPSPRWADAVERGRQIARAGLSRAEPAGAVGGGRRRWRRRNRLGRRFWLGGLEKRVPVAPDTRFRIGHVSKALTSAAVGLLLEKGRLHLDDEIQTYVPAFPRKQWPVTLRQLMGHVAGVRHYRDEEADVPSAHCERASEGLQSFADDPLLFEPETQYRYSTYGWVLVSAAVEAAANEPFFTFMRTQVFAPLGMTDDDARLGDRTDPGSGDLLLPEIQWRKPVRALKLARPVDYSCFAGAGAFLSTPSDLVRFGMAMNSGKLLQPAPSECSRRHRCWRPARRPSTASAGCSRPFPLAGEPTRLASHASRSLLGGSTSFMTFPDRGIVVAVTTNTSYADTRSIALKIAEAFVENPR